MASTGARASSDIHLIGKEQGEGATAAGQTGGLRGSMQFNAGLLISSEPSEGSLQDKQAASAVDDLATSICQLYKETVEAPGSEKMSKHNRHLFQRDIVSALRKVQNVQHGLEEADRFFGPRRISLVLAFLVFAFLVIFGTTDIAFYCATATLALTVGLMALFFSRFLDTRKMKYVLSSGISNFLMIYASGMMTSVVVTFDGTFLGGLVLLKYAGLWLLTVFIILLDICACGRKYHVVCLILFNVTLLTSLVIAQKEDVEGLGTSITMLGKETTDTSIIRVCLSNMFFLVLPGVVAAAADQHHAITYVFCSYLHKADVYPKGTPTDTRVIEGVTKIQAILEGEAGTGLDHISSKELVEVLIAYIRAQSEEMVPPAHPMDCTGWTIVSVCIAFFLLLALRSSVYPALGAIEFIPMDPVTLEGGFNARDMVWIIICCTWTTALGVFLRKTINRQRLAFLVQTPEIYVMLGYTTVQFVAMCWSWSSDHGGYGITVCLMAFVGWQGSCFIALLDACDCSNSFRRRLFFGFLLVSIMAMIDALINGGTYDRVLPGSSISLNTIWIPCQMGMINAYLVGAAAAWGGTDGTLCFLLTGELYKEEMIATSNSRQERALALSEKLIDSLSSEHLFQSSVLAVTAASGMLRGVKEKRRRSQHDTALTISDASAGSH